MRARNMTLQDIATELGVAKSSVSLWVRDVPFTPSKRRTGPQNRPHPAHEAKLAQIAALNAEGERAHRHARATKRSSPLALRSTQGKVPRPMVTLRFANTDPTMVRFFCAWLRRFFAIDETRLRVRVYLHEGLDLDAAEAHWSEVTGIPSAQFGKAYRAVADPSIRLTKHEFGCVYVDILAAPRPIAASWGSSGRCYRRAPFRGSSIGGAAAC